MAQTAGGPLPCKHRRQDGSEKDNRYTANGDRSQGAAGCARSVQAELREPTEGRKEWRGILGARVLAWAEGVGGGGGTRSGQEHFGEKEQH